MYKLYVGLGYLPKYGAQDAIAQLDKENILVQNPKEADLFVFPVNYEKLYGYTEHERNHFDFQLEEIDELKKSLSKMIKLAVTHNKKVVLFYYYDPVSKIEIENAVVFRTSLLKSTRDKNEFSMPAYGQDLRQLKSLLKNEFWIKKSDVPSVGFRGQSAPLKFPLKLAIKRSINKLSKSLGFNAKFNLHYNFGYLARRDAIVSCLKNKGIKTDITLTSAEQSWDPVTGKLPFVNNVFNNPYNICVSGHGNYSFRLYEIMSAGRIPVFINTDCVLPFEEFIDWKKHVVWVEEKDANKADRQIIEFHRSIHPDDFLQLQKNNRELWENYLSKEGFFRSINQYFPILCS